MLKISSQSGHSLFKQQEDTDGVGGGGGGQCSSYFLAYISRVQYTYRGLQIG